MSIRTPQGAKGERQDAREMPQRSVRRAAGRLPSLDGFRAFSIGFLLWGHLHGTSGFPLPSVADKAVNWGHFGVTVFFVISGYLITRLLLSEQRKAGRIDLAAFYLRRTFRIFPAYYTLVLFAAVGAGAGWLQLESGDLLAAMTYTMNYHPDRAWYLAHSWSLAVEEQFYLLWPAALLLLGTRRGLWAAAIFVVAAPLLRFCVWQFGGAGYAQAIVGNSFETTADAIAVGCVLAGVQDWLWARPAYRRCLASPWFLLVPVLGLSMSSLESHPSLYAWAHSVIIVCIAATVDRYLRFPDGPVGRLLNSRPLVYVGGLSYSIYLWQQPFVNRYADSASTSFPVNLLFVVSLALLSYYLVEQPCLRLRHRVELGWNRPPRRWAPVSDRAGSATSGGKGPE